MQAVCKAYVRETPPQNSLIRYNSTQYLHFRLFLVPEGFGDRWFDGEKEKHM